MKISLTVSLIAAALFCAAPALAQTPPPPAPMQVQPAPAQIQPAPAQAAPEAETAPAPTDWMTYKNPYVGEENDIGNPHRTPDEIATWAQQAATDVLSFTPADYKDKLNGFKKYFVPQGWQLYTAYLKDSNLLSMVTDQGYSVGTIVDSHPEIVNSGAVDGVYHWIVKAPVTISFFITDASGKIKPGAAGKYNLFIDMARVAAGGQDGVAISNWRVDNIAAP
jgi:hypothetical protein